MTRRDSKGRVLLKGESFRKKQKLYVYSYTDRWGKRRFEYSKDLIALREKKDRIEQNRLDKIEHYIVGKADINYVFDRYLATKTEIRATTKSNYIYTYDRYVRSGFGKKKIDGVLYSDVVLFYVRLLRQGLSISTVDSIHSVLHPTFQLAVRDRVLRSNPTDGALAEVKRNIGKAEARHALSLEEERAFLGFLDQDEYRIWKPLFTVMFGTGMRIGELVGLRRCDVDLQNRQISVNHSLAYFKNREKANRCQYIISKPKTMAGIRTIPMLEQVYDAFIEEFQYQELSGHHCIVEVDGMSGFIFCNRFGKVHNPSGINRAIKRIVDDYNASEVVNAKRENRNPVILPRFSCHVARHTFCSRLCENETNIKVIQSVMGHKDIQTTMDIYAEVSEKKKNEVFADLNKKNVL